MGMDVFGNNGNYFRANIWSWRPITYAMELADFEVPESWHCNQGAGLTNQVDCDDLADKLERFLKSWDETVLSLSCSTLAVDGTGRFVSPDTPGAESPYRVRREHLEEFVSFLRNCGGFQIH